METNKLLFTPHGKNLVAGEWTGNDTTFQSQPAFGSPHVFSAGSPELIDVACNAAEDAFWSFGYLPAAERAKFLIEIASEIDSRGPQITEIGSQETGLPVGRLEGERGRTVFQLRLFAEHILEGDYLDQRHDVSLPDRQPLPRPDLKMFQRPIGPVAVFGASNFPLAFSVAGGDTAAAFAAGCPVVVKGHPAHPGTSEIIAEAIHAAVQTCDLHPGVFSLIHDGGLETGQALVQHPCIQAVGFTGSLNGGRALFDLCAARPTPIPFFGELGSINPMFLLPAALAARAKDIGAGWAGSLTMGAGQFCTNPGVAVVVEGNGAAEFVSSTIATLKGIEAQPMLTEGIAKAYHSGQAVLNTSNGSTELVSSAIEPRNVTPSLFEVSGDSWLQNEALHEEVFGPLGVVVRASSVEQMLEIAHKLKGQLTCTLHLDDTDTDLGKSLLPILERKAGRILVNGYPTGVEVCDSMVHGGPYPASTNFGATSVGTLSIRRFLRPVCYQDVPNSLLPTI